MPWSIILQLSWLFKISEINFCSFRLGSAFATYSLVLSFIRQKYIWAVVVAQWKSGRLRHLRFESSHRQTFNEHLFTVNCVEKTKIKKRGREWLILKQKYIFTNTKNFLSCIWYWDSCTLRFWFWTRTVQCPVLVLIHSFYADNYAVFKSSEFNFEMRSKVRPVLLRKTSSTSPLTGHSSSSSLSLLTEPSSSGWGTKWKSLEYV